MLLATFNDTTNSVAYINLSIAELESGVQIAGYTCPEYCSLVTSCGECGLEAACTWCESTATCLAKSEACASNGTESASNGTEPGCCASCAAHTNCSACAAEPGCGWCFSSGSCLSGGVGRWCDTRCESVRPYPQSGETCTATCPKSNSSAGEVRGIMGGGRGGARSGPDADRRRLSYVRPPAPSPPLPPSGRRP